MNIISNEFGQWTFSISNDTMAPNGFTNSLVNLDTLGDMQLKGYEIVATSNKCTSDIYNISNNNFNAKYNIIDTDIIVESNGIKLDCDCIRQNTTIYNNDKTSHIIMQAGVMVHDVAKGDILSRLGDGSILVHLCVNKWCGEGQWRSFTPEDLGIYFSTTHPMENKSFTISSISSWSTEGYYPIVIVEDKVRNVTSYVEVESGANWFIQLFSYGANECDSIFVKAGDTDITLGNRVQLKPNSSYTTCNVLYGSTYGGFTDGVHQLLKAKRQLSLTKKYNNIVYNDYMNCNWAKPTKEKLIPLIDAASKLGVDTFCIDDGWAEQGVWDPLDNLFGEGGLKSIIDYIISKGMIPGLWFEFERASQKVASQLPKDYLQYRDGKVIQPHRPKVNMMSKASRQYLLDKVDAVYKMGVRFIKNDHNNTEDYGISYNNESYGEGTRNQAQAFTSFIDELTAKYPDLIIENCGSGGGRCDNATLSHFHLQSISDQEDYINNVSILMGMSALVPTEKAGVWCYPYPLRYEDNKKVQLDEKQLNEFRDGKQTIFNVVSGCMGSMYISGKINQMDEFNFNILKQGIDFYKNNIMFIHNAYPIYPNGLKRLSYKGCISMGLIDEKESCLLLAVWNTAGEENSIVVDLNKYNFMNCHQVFPTISMGKVNYFDKKLSLSIPSKSAIIYKLH